MDRPLSPASSAGRSLVGTLLAVGLLLAMITTGLTLMAATEARHVPTARFPAAELERQRCPDDVRTAADVPSNRTCMTLTVHNAGDADGTARCEISDEPAGAEARFAANDVHIYSTAIDAGDTRRLPIYVDGGGKNADQIGGTCDLVPPPEG
jgi:hypothetical protein